MTSFASIRNPQTDPLLTPKNCAIVIIDFQPLQVGSITSMDRRLLVANITALARIARLYEIPVVLSTVNVATGRNQPTIQQITNVLDRSVALDRTSINAWEDEDFVAAVKATGRRKLIMAALWTEVCLAFPALDALYAGYEVFPVVDAVGGTSPEAHRAGLERIINAGAQPVSWIQVACEMQRDWKRSESVAGFSEIVFGAAGH
jgi:nicotinamidase-related amidase